MANVQVENGYTKIANEILENMAQIKLSPTQYRLVFVIWRFTYGYGRKEHDLSLAFLSEATGGCDKRQIQRELKALEDKKIIYQRIKSGAYRIIGFNKNHEEWEGKLPGTIGEIVNATVGKTVNGESEENDESIGETVNPAIGESINGSKGVGEMTIGETINTGVGETVNTTIGETVNQERNKENFKEINDDEEENAHVEMPPQEIFQAIETKYIQRRARGTQITPQDDQDIKQVIAYGIPLEHVLQFIDERFETYQPKHPRDRINSFGYVADYIFQRHYDEQQKKAELEARKKSKVTLIRGGKTNESSRELDPAIRDELNSLSF